MHSTIVISSTDRNHLENLFSHQSPGVPPPTQEQAAVIHALLDAARITSNETDLESRVGFHDLITLVSPTDSRDFFNFSVVPPAEADVDADRISVVMPVALAVLGRRCGENVQWITPRGIREMRIIAVRKNAMETV